MWQGRADCNFEAYCPRKRKDFGENHVTDTTGAKLLRKFPVGQKNIHEWYRLLDTMAS